MARVHLPTSQPFYTAAERFVERALRSDDSLFTPGQPIWTAANIADLHRRFNEQPDTSGASFLDKFRKQLAGVNGLPPASPAIYQLAGEIIFVHLLIARGSIGGQAKRNLITTVLGWSPAPITMPPDMDEAIDHGLAKVGTAYLTFRPFQLWFLIDFAQAWKQLSLIARDQHLQDPWSFKAMVFSLPIDRAYAQREALLHLVFPDTFEPIVSRDHKQRFARDYAAYLTDTTTDVDRKLLNIREEYASKNGHQLDFYGRNDPITPPSASSSPLPRSLGKQLNPYVQFVMHLKNRLYTPEQLLERLEQIRSSVPLLTPVPSGDELARDLVHLRLLQQQDDGTYQRRPEISDLTLDHLMRYAALTMLVPRADGTYDLPVLHAPTDYQPHPVSDWPYGTALLGWYEEAQLVAHNSDGTYQWCAGALDPLRVSTQAAQTLNTFLSNLARVRQSQRDLPEIEDAPLTLIDAATLDERIAEIQRELLIDRLTILRIYRALLAGQHVILSGPPGTGKTHLARLIPRILWRDPEPTVVFDMPTEPNQPVNVPLHERRLYREGYTATVVTASEDWGVRHVIGGIVPRLMQDGGRRSLIYAISHGNLTRAVLTNYAGYDGENVPPAPLLRKELNDGNGNRYRGQWLVIDEFTRAPIDAAFGSLLTTLGGQRSPLMVPLDGGGEHPITLPRDFRIIGTLNSFDRHFLNQISEAMKRRFTFIDVLPPNRALADVEQGTVVFRTIARLVDLGFDDMHAEGDEANWDDVLTVVRNNEGNEHYPLHYTFTFEDEEARAAITSLWRVLLAVRVYRQLGTAQAEAVTTALFTGRSIGMSWPESLDSALADTLADQLQVLGRDEQRVLTAFLRHAAQSEAFAHAVSELLTELPLQKRRAHEQHLGGITADTLGASFALGEALALPQSGLFERRLGAFAEERGL